MIEPIPGCAMATSNSRGDSNTILVWIRIRVDPWSGKKHQKAGQERGVFEGEKAPEKGPPQLTDVWCLEMVPDAGVRRDVDGGAL
jgi:hypothetical protein